MTEDKRKEVIESLRLFDDVFMKRCFKNHKECVELVVRIVLNNKELQFVEFKDQEILPNIDGKSAILDFVIKDDKGKYYDVEIESAKSNASGYQRRARFYSSLLDTYYLSKGSEYNELPDSYVIFFCEKDVIGRGKPLYVINSKIQQTGEKFEDGRTIIFVNGEIEDDTPLGRLVRDFKLTDPNEMCYDVLRKARRTEMRNYFLTTGRPENELLDNYLKKYEDVARKEGRVEGRAERSIEVAKALLADGVPLEKVSQYSSIPVEELKNLK